jgi:pullulanase/glycogen debranching enzyme
MALVAEPGSAHPLGMTTYPDGVNFSLFSESATEVLLLLFDRAAAIEPAQVIRLDPFSEQDLPFLAMAGGHDTAPVAHRTVSRPVQNLMNQRDRNRPFTDC